MRVETRVRVSERETEKVREWWGRDVPDSNASILSGKLNNVTRTAKTNENVLRQAKQSRLKHVGVRFSNFTIRQLLWAWPFKTPNRSSVFVMRLAKHNTLAGFHCQKIIMLLIKRNLKTVSLCRAYQRLLCRMSCSSPIGRSKNIQLDKCCFDDKLIL